MKDKSNFGIQECSKCQYKLRCEECIYNEKDIAKILFEEHKETTKKIFRKIDEKFCFFTDGKQSEEYEKGYSDGVLAVGKMITELAKQLDVDIKE